MPAPAWSTQQLAEFLTAVSAADSEAAAARVAVERAAEALDAEVAAIVCDRELVACIGYPDGAAPVAELASVVPARADCRLPVPGVGPCPAACVALEHPPGATMVVARSGADGLGPEESGLLRGMARVTSMTMRMLRLLADERSARALLERLAAEQAALRRVATLVAGQTAPDAIFAAVAEEVGRLLGADAAGVCRYEPDATVTVVSSWGRDGGGLPVGMRLPVAKEGVAATVLRTGRPARVDSYDDLSGPVGEVLRELGARSSVGAPIVVNGRVWGAMIASSTRRERLAGDSESRITEFTELAAIAISNAAGHAQLAASRARIVTTADETRRRIERDLHDGIQQRLVALALNLRAAGERVPPDRPDLRADLARVETTLKDVLDELREISRGVHPAILSQGGLGPALKAIGRRSPLPVQLQLGSVGRLPQAVEVAAYYAVSEALANAAKHANASVAHVEVGMRDGRLRVSVFDNGVGGADPARGSGIVGLTDRVEALGGTIELRSPPGEGTLLVLELPATPR